MGISFYYFIYKYPLTGNKGNNFDYGGKATWSYLLRFLCTYLLTGNKGNDFAYKVKMAEK